MTDADAASEFSPDAERARHARVIDTLRAASLHRPAWVLSTRADLAAMLESHAAARGGAFARFDDWNSLATRLDDALDLPALASPSDTARALYVERCLDAMSRTDASLRDALQSDPFGLSRALLHVLDALRHHGDARAITVPTETASDALIARHLGLLSELTRRYEALLDADGALDTVARLTRITRALDGYSKPLPLRALTVVGPDALTPLQRRLFDALARHDVAVDLPPWVGATDAVRGASRAVCAVVARDPHDEAEAVAQWIAEEIARGACAEDFAVAVDPSPAALDRLSRALARYDVASHGAAQSPVHLNPLWQTVRASIRLAWRGVDVIDLSTALASPGSGIWGADRDWLLAELRRHTPASWKAVREVLLRCTTVAAQPERADALDAPDTEDGTEGDTGSVTVIELDAPPDQRAAQLLEVRARVEDLIAVWESAGPLARRPQHERIEALNAAVTQTLSRFVHPMRFRDALPDARTSSAWVWAADAIRAACDTALERIERTRARLPDHDPGAFLNTAAALLGASPDGARAPLRDGVALLTDTPFVARRPRTLIVTGFHRGRFPSPVARSLLLGPLEQDALRRVPGFEGFPDDHALARVARRESDRTLSLPTERLVLTRAARLADGAPTDASLTWKDLQSAPSARWISPAQWLAESFPDGPRTRRARIAQSLSALGDGRIDVAASLGAPFAREDLGVRDLFAARFRPDARFDVADLVAPSLTTAVYTPRALETLLKCRYSFLTSALLGIRSLPLARAPSLSAQDRTRVTRAALKSLDAVSSPTPADLSIALEGAIQQHLPWAERPDMRFALEELRRTVAPFLARYLELRQRWALTAPAEPTDPSDKPVALALSDGRALRLAPLTPRIETRSSSSGTQSLLMEFRLGSTEPMRHLRDAGLDLDAALAPAIAAAQSGHNVTSFVRLSLSKPEAELLSNTDQGPDPRSVKTTVVSIDDARPLSTLHELAIDRITQELDALSAPDAQYAPHTEERARELADAGARSCEFCAMNLGCRFKMAGGM